MTNQHPGKLYIQDVSLRDGMHAVRHQYDLDTVRKVAKALDEAHVDGVEICHGDGLAGTSFTYGFAAHSDVEWIAAVAEVLEFARPTILLLPGIGTLHELREAYEAGARSVRVATHCTEADVSKQHIEAARNLGMAKARGDFFIFIDSDCTVASNWLRAVAAALENEAADAFGGPDSYRDDFPPLLKAINYSMTSFITTGGIRGHKKKRLGRYYPRSFNMGLSRAVYEKIGGFGKLRHGQDIEFSHRIIESGAKVILVPDAVVFHKRRTSLKKFFRQVFNWGVARINLYKIDRKLLEPVHALPALATLVLFLLLCAAVVFPVLRPALGWLLLVAAAVLLLSGIDAARHYRSARLLYLVPLVMPIQVVGYGLGFISAYLARVVFSRKEFSGFTRKYYH